MNDISERISLSSKRLRHEMAVAFGLVAMAILVFVGYLFPGVSSFFFVKTHLYLVMAIVFFIIILGFLSVVQMIEPVIKISHEAKKIADGDLTRQIELGRDDEIGELGQALNRMTMRIRHDMEELKVFSEKTEEINSEINKRIVALSSLLQISSLISQNTPLDEIIELGVDRCVSAGEMSFGCLILKDRYTSEFGVKTILGHQRRSLAEKGVNNFKVKLSDGLLGRAILKQESIVLDKNSKVNDDIKALRELFSCANMIIVPVASRDKVHGLLIGGHDKYDFAFSSTDVELLQFLSKQIAVAIESSLLNDRIEKLEITDSLTGLFNHTFVEERLDEEIKRAINFQRPCAFALFGIDRFDEYLKAHGHIAAESVLIKVGSLLKENISEVEKAARFGDHEFALVLPERNKRQGIEIADQIRKKIEYLFSEEDDESKRLTCSGAVSENPVDGISADQLIEKARMVLDLAQKQGGNRILYKV